MQHVWDRSDVYRVLARKPEGMKPLGMPRPIWKVNIKIDHQNV